MADYIGGQTPARPAHPPRGPRVLEYAFGPFAPAIPHVDLLICTVLGNRLDSAEVQYERLGMALDAYQPGNRIEGYFRCHTELYFLLVALSRAVSVVQRLERRLGLPQDATIAATTGDIATMRHHFEHIDQRAEGDPGTSFNTTADLYANFGVIENAEVRFGLQVLQFARLAPVLDAIHGLLDRLGFPR